MSTAVTTVRQVVPASKLSVRGEPLAILLVAGICAIISAQGSLQAGANAGYAFGIAQGVVTFIAVRNGLTVHANPLLSIGAAVARVVGSRAAVRSLIAFAAIFVGTLVAAVVYGWTQAAKAQFGAPVPAAHVPLHEQFGYAVLSGFILVLVGLAAATFIRSAFFAALLMGLDLGMCVYFFESKTGGGVNTARDLAPMILAGHWYWYALIGEVVGAVLAGLAFLPINRRFGLSV